MTALLLDTSGYVAFKRNDSLAVQAIQKSPELLFSVVTLGELLGGFAFGAREDQNLRELSEFRSSYRTSVVPISEVTAQHYAQVYAFLRAQGKPIPTNDMWIAASAIEHGARLLTADSHFSHLPLLLVEYTQR